MASLICAAWRRRSRKRDRACPPPRTPGIGTRSSGKGQREPSEGSCAGHGSQRSAARAGPAPSPRSAIMAPRRQEGLGRVRDPCPGPCRRCHLLPHDRPPPAPRRPGTASSPSPGPSRCRSRPWRASGQRPGGPGSPRPLGSARRTRSARAASRAPSRSPGTRPQSPGLVVGVLRQRQAHRC
eukprot:9329298-Lingulodinium_polyedra.AAC.1